MIVIEPLGTDVILPALVLGYELPEAEELERVYRWGDSPDWIVTLDQQAGGMAMRYPHVAGAVLRLADNADRFSESADFAIRGFRAMAEDPDMGLLQREYPVLLDLVQSWGEDYSRVRLDSLQQFMERHLALPPIESGFEAFIRLAPCDLLQYFAGWKILQAKVLPTFQEVYTNQPCPRAEQGNLAGLVLSSEAVMDADKLSGLQQLGKLAGQSNPRAFFLWENCD